MSKKYNRDQIGEIVNKIQELGLGYVAGAREFNIPIRHIYRYNNETKQNHDLSTDENCQGRELAEPTTNLDSEQKAKPAASSLPADIQSIIINYRKEHPDHGYRRIEDYLRDKYFIKVARKQIRKILKVHGLEKILDSSFDREAEPAKGSRRFEASSPRELYQMDVSYVYISGLPVFYFNLIRGDFHECTKLSL